MSKFAQGEILDVLKKKMRTMKDELEQAREQSEERQLQLSEEIKKREKVRPKLCNRRPQSGLFGALPKFSACFQPNDRLLKDIRRVDIVYISIFRALFTKSAGRDLFDEMISTVEMQLFLIGWPLFDCF